ncbi:MAG: hypothetical protein ABF247_12415 [Nonlabens sp.]|uniref:hypothetical protein n=1 Tax=Nonlabens sp. TaxID=1888209 RepID=UPI0032196ACC
MKTLLILFFALLSIQVHSQNTEEYKYLQTVIIDGMVYQLNYLEKDNSFQFQIIKDTVTATTDEYGWDSYKEVLATGIIQAINGSFSENLNLNTLDAVEKTALLALKEKILERKRASLEEEQRVLSDIDNAKDQYSGRLVLKKEAVIRKKETSDNCENDLINQLGPKVVLTNEVVKINKALVQFFNNKASSIYVEATYNNEKIIFLNTSFSVPLRWFNTYGMSVTAITKNCEAITIDYNDVFDFESDQFFNYSIANDQVKLNTKTEKERSQPVKQRRFFDFFTGVIYSDVLGLNSSNSNSVLNAQATLLVPMNTRNWSKVTATRQFLVSTSVALNNSFEDSTRFMGFQNGDRVNEFDLFTKRNINVDLYLDLLTYESKGWFLNTSLGYKGSFYRTGYRFTEVATGGLDQVQEGQVFSTGHGPYLNFEFRPQNNFGADINFHYESFEFSDQVELGTTDFEKNVLNQKGDLVHVKANFYWLTNPQNSDGGIYTSLGTSYHTGTDGVFPQFMIGYATNLTSFVNRIKK